MRQVGFLTPVREGFQGEGPPDGESLESALMGSSKQLNGVGLVRGGDEGCQEEGLWPQGHWEPQRVSGWVPQEGMRPSTVQEGLRRS